MSFALPKPAVSPATAPLPDFTADMARKPDAAQQTGAHSTFDAMMARHTEQVQHAQAANKAPAKTAGASADKPQASATHDAAKPASPKTVAKPHADTDKPQKATEQPAADTAVKPEDDKAVAQADGTTATAAASADGQTADPADQAPAETSDLIQTDADPAATAAVLAIQVQTQVQVQPLSQTQAPSQDAEADDAQLAALPQAKPNPKASKPSAPIAPEDAVLDAAPADEAKDAAKPDDAVFAALLAQAVPAQAAAPAAPVKTGKAIPSATDKPAVVTLAELTLKPGASSGKAADALVTLADGRSADASADQADADQTGDQKPSPFPAADSRDSSQPIKAQPVLVSQTPQPLTPELAANAQVVPRPQDNMAGASAFSLQTAPADVAGGYSATGAQTASATTLSRASVETMAALGLQISKKLSEGVTKFAVELHPADLGKVEVSLNIGRDGKTTAHLRFDSPVTASTFSAHEGELRQQLANAGLKLDEGSLSFSSRDGDASGQGFAQMFQGQEQASHGQAARALKTASDQAEQVDADAALDAALADFHNRPANSTLALNLVV